MKMFITLIAVVSVLGLCEIDFLPGGKWIPASMDLEEKLDVIYDYQEGLAKAQEEQKPVFLLFTANQCANNLELKEKIAKDRSLVKLLQKEFVSVWLYVDDKTPLSDEEMTPSIRTIGNKWAALEKDKFNSSFQPLMVMMDAQENYLKSPQCYGRIKDKLEEVVVAGLEEFKKG